MTDWPLEVRVASVCVALAAIAFTASQGVIISAVAAAILLLIYGLVG